MKRATVAFIVVIVAPAVVSWFIPRLLPPAVLLVGAACGAAQWWGWGEAPPARREATFPALILAFAAILYVAGAEAAGPCAACSGARRGRG